jgi:hypothetical protein
MRRILQILTPIVIFVTVGFYNYFSMPYPTTIYFIQTVPNESLAIGHDRSLHVGDNVTVIGRVVAPPRVNPAGGDFRRLLRGTTSWTAYIQDTANNIWGGIIVRQGDTVSNTGFDQLDSGAKVQLSGIVQEFPDIISSGATQIALDSTQFVQTLPTIRRRPLPIAVNISDFDSAGYIKFMTGEKYEGMYVQINNVEIGPQSPNSARHIRRIIDANGNFIYIRDFSNFFSISPNGAGWTPWTPPSSGATVNFIRGVIINGGVTEPPQGLYPYVIVPIYPNDFQLGNTPPLIGSVSRVPAIPKPPDSVQVNATVVDTLMYPLSVDSVQLFYRINKGQYTIKPMGNVGNIYFTKIPPQPNGTLVEYFIKAKDNQGGIRLNPSDTGRSTYFYRVRLSDTMSIYDIQWTPNQGGFSAYSGYDVVVTGGIVTCDTSDIPAFQFTSSGGTQTSPRRVIIQDPNIAGGWSGVWINGAATDPLVKGQLVRVRGTVEESFGITRINIATPSDITVISSSNPLPPFQNLTPAVVANSKQDGDTTIERWESVLVKFDQMVAVSCIVANGQGTACEFTIPVPDSTFRRNFGEMFVVKPGEGIEARIELQDGNHDFTNGWDSARANWWHPNYPGNLLYQWDGITTLQGVLYYSFGRYKLVPRSNNDFGSAIGMQNQNESPSSFYLKQNYPNPFNPVTNIVYNIPTESDVKIIVYNLLGQVVKTLVDGIQNRGRYEIKFDGRNYASGMYIYVLEAETFEGQKFRDVKKMVLVK